MYDVNLTDSYFPAQGDAEIRELTVGGLLREVAEIHANAVAMVDVDDAGVCGREWTYGDLLGEAERLALALTTRFSPGERLVVWAPNIPDGSWWSMQLPWRALCW